MTRGYASHRLRFASVRAVSCNFVELVGQRVRFVAFFAVANRVHGYVFDATRQRPLQIMARGPTAEQEPDNQGR